MSDSGDQAKADLLDVRDLFATVVRCAQLSVRAGECVALTGVSGSGKTRLFRAIADLDPCPGQVVLAGKRHEQYSAPSWRRRVMFVPAEPAWWAVQVLAHFYVAPDEGLLNRLGFKDETMDWAIDRLSTGERQRLALARALVFKLRILLLDEPTSALDSDNKLAVEALLREFVEAGGGIIFTTHEVDQVARAHACASTLHRRWSAVGGTDVMYIQIDDLDLLIGAALLMLNAGLSMMMQLGLARQLLVAAGRMTVQLLLVGLVLKAVFAVGSLWMTIALAVIVCLFVGFEVRARQERRLRGFWGYGLSAGAVMFVGTLVTLFALTVQIEPVLWYTPRYAIPLLGMIMGNVMTGVSLALNDIGLNVARERNSIEAQLALGATRWQALKPATRRALRSGFISIINAMAATGVVALPGMMTGQILAGVDPNEAVRYQLLVMFMIAGATSLGVYLAVFATLVRLTDERHRLRLDRLTP